MNQSVVCVMWSDKALSILFATIAAWEFSMNSTDACFYAYQYITNTITVVVPLTRVSAPLCVFISVRLIMQLTEVRTILS